MNPSLDKIKSHLVLLNKLGKRINLIDTMLGSISSTSMKEDYNTKLISLVDGYKMGCAKIELELKSYVRNESEVKNMWVRRVLKSLRKVA